MAIKDLLWACPACHQLESLDGAGRCRSCQVAFSRGRGGRIRAVTSEGTLELPPIEWLARLPWPDLDGDGRALPAGLEPPFTQPASVRVAIGEQALRRGADLLGFVERYGIPVTVRLTLSTTALSAEATTDAAPGNNWSWALHDITAIQLESSAIQLKARGAPAVSVRFPDGSLRLWEQRLQYCVRRAYAAAGKGEIVEFQPHVRTR